MNHALDHLTQQWGLTFADQQRIAPGLASETDDTRPVEQCLDIARALSWLLGDAPTIRTWLRTPHPALYHLTPLDVALGSASGRGMLRVALLEEAAAKRDRVALSALAGRW